ELKMNIWRKLSIKQKFLTVFIIQNISIALSLWVLDVDFGIILLFFIAFCFYQISDEVPKKIFFIFNICILLLLLPDNCFNLMQNFNIDYNKLKHYSGENVYSEHTAGKSSPSFHLVLKNNEQELGFRCSQLNYYDDCNREISQYFGYVSENYYGNNISVKYTEISHIRMMFVVPFISKEKVIYEIKHNDKIIYGYDYFINKFSQQRKNLLIFVVYVILNSVVFCFFYHWIQKDFLKHSQ
ncbi:MAG: hypothetical protein IKI11_00220, partial [Neisseriaceae bacterium]|nr:hypothetical protein [Neisseriaceae bacterium]